MPLHAHDGLVLVVALDAFYHSVEGACCHYEVGSRLFYCLMVKRVDLQTCRLVVGGEHGVVVEEHRVRRLRAVGVL